MTDNALIVACCDHRARFRIPSRRNDALYFEKLAKKLSEHPDVKGITTNPLTASVLVHFGHDDCLEGLVRFAARKRLFRAKRVETLPTLGELVWRRAQQFDGAIETLTRGRLNSENLLFLLFLGLGLVQLQRGQIMQPAIPLLWRAVSLLRQIHEDESTSSRSPRSFQRPLKSLISPAK